MDCGYPLAASSKVALYNPLGKIPVLRTDEGEAIYDSAVIVDYLEVIAPTPALVPSAPLERVAVKRWEALGDGLLDAAVGIMSERRRDPKEQSPSWIAKQQEKIERALAVASEQLGEKIWCCGDSYTLADIAVGVCLFYLDFRLPELARDNHYANLLRLQQTLGTWPAFKDTRAEI